MSNFESVPNISALLEFRTIETQPFTPITTSQLNVNAAVNMYQKHLKNVSDYQKRNRGKMNQKQKDFLKKLKEEKPEQFAVLLEKKKLYYQQVIKPKKEQEKAAALLQNQTLI
jgi:hypothetical protein